MAIVGQRIIKHRKHNFLVNIEEITRATFTTCSDLKATIEPIEYRESGDLEPEKLPGLANTDNITLTRGATNSIEFWNWFKQGADFRKQGGLSDDLVIRSMDIQELARDKETVLVTWPINEAWITELTLGDWDANANETTVRTMVLAVRGIQDPVVG